MSVRCIFDLWGGGWGVNDARSVMSNVTGIFTSCILLHHANQMHLRPGWGVMTYAFGDCLVLIFIFIVPNLQSVCKGTVGGGETQAKI